MGRPFSFAPVSNDLQRAIIEAVSNTLLAQDHRGCTNASNSDHDIFSRPALSADITLCTTITL